MEVIYSMAMYVYMQDRDTYGDGVDELYEIKLPPIIGDNISHKAEDFDEEKENNPTLLSPVLEIPNSDYPRNMNCFEFGSKIYFFGGYGQVMSPFSLEFLDDNCCPNLYFFDTNHPSSGLQEGPPMSTGKPSPCSSFVAGGMIYVVAGNVMSYSSKLSNRSINRFERFNPVEGTWTVLDDTPLADISFCIFTTVFETHHKVVIVGCDLKHSKLYRLIYDFKYQKWDSGSRLLVSAPGQWPRYFYHVGDDESSGGTKFVYGHQRHPPVPVKLGPLKDPYQLHKLPLEPISLVDDNGANNTGLDLMRKAFYRPMGFDTKYKLHNLGDGYFCYVITGQTCYERGNWRDCSHTCKVRVIIFKELSSQVQGHLSFQAKLLYIQHYAIKMRSHESFKIEGCCFVPPLN